MLIMVRLSSVCTLSTLVCSRYVILVHIGLSWSGSNFIYVLRNYSIHLCRARWLCPLPTLSLPTLPAGQRFQRLCCQPTLSLPVLSVAVLSANAFPASAFDGCVVSQRFPCQRFQWLCCQPTLSLPTLSGWLCRLLPATRSRLLGCTLVALAYVHAIYGQIFMKSPSDCATSYMDYGQIFISLRSVCTGLHICYGQIFIQSHVNYGQIFVKSRLVVHELWSDRALFSC